MKVFCTGATGFVGAHSALALLAAGHELRLLVRDEHAARAWFEAHERPIQRCVTADIRDSAALAHAMAGCDAVLHAAAAVSVNPRRAREMYDTNVGGTTAVLGAASEAGIRNIVYVSSVMVYFHPGAPRVDEYTALADVSDPYTRSKRDSEIFARDLQRRGAPVQITYPTAVIGPDDPKLSAANRALANCIATALPRSSGGFQCVDVRDLADAHVWLLEHPRVADFEGGRYIVGGQFYPWDDLRHRLEAILGKRVFSPRVPPRLLRGMGAVADAVKQLVPFDTQLSAEAMAISTQWPPADSSRFLATSGFRFRGADETFTDTIRWMLEAGHVPAKKAGRLAAPTLSVSERPSAP
ncbi:NAD-dependent epimerase/dehydratase family protein [Mycobacterium sp. NPDC048908]|uniref:NAD-dependent epimerase/dehydratase family protein n=1 Tax=Mycobacterium sp. NPDC048908 TaxID=3364292 RepID=UPI003723B130